ncbi:MAG: transcription elongation factor GreA [Pelagibacteraceae bacterium]|nr:transcription elongation factor GreA [Pelagibacteraceae bacterium]PPR51667.1 MAG: Transcription elongation factor GreA [Alphaproteobacteria bacterium MarineAlpha5_Bin10]|tara:strand:+ start:113 stop:586 length:474 start_codon:yes stop_codon:yes gene_type:complete
MTKFPLTSEGFEMLQSELKQLIHEERPNIIKAIAEARSHGDLSENAEYHSAKEKQSFIEGKIAELESIIAQAEVIDVSKLSGKEIKFGATVSVIEEESGQKSTYQIVGESESDIQNNKLSISSPLARALIGREKGSMVEFKSPKGIKTYSIKSVQYK